jgi:hypothetical protein
MGWLQRNILYNGARGCVAVQVCYCVCCCGPGCVLLCHTVTVMLPVRIGNSARRECKQLLCIVTYAAAPAARCLATLRILFSVFDGELLRILTCALAPMLTDGLPHFFACSCCVASLTACMLVTQPSSGCRVRCKPTSQSTTAHTLARASHRCAAARTHSSFDKR